MAYDDPTHWHSRADELRVLAENMKAGLSSHMMRWIAEDYMSLRMVFDGGSAFSADDT